MIFVLTTRGDFRDFMSSALRGLSISTQAVEDIDTLAEHMLVAGENVNVFVDVRSELPNDILETIRSVDSSCHIVAVQTPADNGSPLLSFEGKAKTDDFVLLPAMTETSACILLDVISRLPRDKPKPANLGEASRKSKPSSEDQKPVNGRYLASQSHAIQQLIRDFQSWGEEDRLAMLYGNEGTEFELMARELNFQKTADDPQLFHCEDGEISIDALEKLEREATQDGRVHFAYLGLTEVISPDSFRELELFIQHLNAKPEIPLRLIVSHSLDSSEFLSEDYLAKIERVSQISKVYQLPSLRERLEDIRPLCLAILSNLRAAHTFTRVKTISNEAIQSLIDSRDSLTHDKLLRILRNAVGLSQHEQLSVHDLRNFGESDLTTAHLMESSADEKYFPNSINF